MDRKCNAVIVSLLTILALSACDSSKPAPAKASGATASPAPVEAATAAKPEPVVATGPLVVENQVDVAAQREGMLASMAAEVGTSVRKGQILAVLDDRQVTADLEAARARVRAVEANVKNWEAEVKVLETDLERAEKMWAAQLITRQDLDHTRFKLAADQYELEREREVLKHAIATGRSLELEQDKTRVRAPFDGIVARRYVRVGQKIALGDRLFWVTAVTPLRVKFTLPERYIGHVKRGDEVDLTVSDGPDNQYAAKVVQMSPVVDPSSGTIEVMAELVGPTRNLRPGMTATIRVRNRP